MAACSLLRAKSSGVMRVYRRSGKGLRPGCSTAAAVPLITHSHEGVVACQRVHPRGREETGDDGAVAHGSREMESSAAVL